MARREFKIKLAEAEISGHLVSTLIETLDLPFLAVCLDFKPL